jgi:hypothetical protein
MLVIENAHNYLYKTQLGEVFYVECSKVHVIFIVVCILLHMYN